MYTTTVTTTATITTPSPTTTATILMCKYPSCKKKAHRGFEFCGNTHSDLFKTRQIYNFCLFPRCGFKIVPELGDFCTEFHQNAVRETTVPLLKKLINYEFKFKDIELQFLHKWDKAKTGGVKPKVLSIYRIHPVKQLVERFEEYTLKIIENRPQYAEKGKGFGGPGNTHRRFHGTGSMKCQLGISSDTLCTIPECSVCGIIRSGLQMKFVGTTVDRGHGFHRFGKGLYLTSFSSKSNDYNKGLEDYLGENVRSMFLCKVVVGEPLLLEEDDKTMNLKKLQQQGKDSVIGIPGTRLNYDEMVVYEDDPVKVLYYIVYQLPHLCMSKI